MRQIKMAPSGKPDRGQSQCTSGRPVSLINIIAQITEAVARDRIAGEAPKRQASNEYAYTRGGSTSDFICEASNKGHYINLAPIDEGSASDKVPRPLLLLPPQRMGMRQHLQRFVRNWLVNCRLRLYLATNHVIFRSRI